MELTAAHATAEYYAIMPGSSDLPEPPKTSAAAAALSVATRFCSPAVLNHSIRSYLWGALYARAHGIAFDDELSYVSALLHDVGLTEPFDSHWLPFEEAGGKLAWVLGVAAGWPEDRAARVERIIDGHMGVEVSATKDAESHLLQVATSWDVVGQRSEEFPEASWGKVLDRYPRLDFGEQFLALFADQGHASRPALPPGQSNPAEGRSSRRIRSTRTRLSPDQSRGRGGYPPHRGRGASFRRLAHRLSARPAMRTDHAAAALGPPGPRMRSAATRGAA